MENNRKVYLFIKVVRLVIPIIVVIAGIAVAKHLYDTKPVAKRVKPVIPPPLVEVINLKSIDHLVVINSMGKVISSQTISLKSRVSGFVVETSPEFIAGGIYRKGDVMLKLDPKDFELALKQQEAMLQKAEASLKLEMGKQEVARAELRLIQKTSAQPISDTNLALRVPHLEQIKAEISAIKVDIEKARLNLERTTIRAPFNCMIISTDVEIGSQISSQEALAVISGIDEYHVQVTVPVDQLKWIDFPKDIDTPTRGSDVLISTKDGGKYHGEVIKLLGSLNDKSRLAPILISIHDPLCLKRGCGVKNPLLIDSYIQADIQGKSVENIFSIPRAAVRDGDKIWLAQNRKNSGEPYSQNSPGNNDNSKQITLCIKTIKPLWKDRESVYIKEGVKDGETLIVSELSSPVHGMSIKVNDTDIKPEIDF